MYCPIRLIFYCPVVKVADKQKSRTTSVAMTMVIFGSPAFLDQRIRNFLSLPYDRFGFIIFLRVDHKAKQISTEKNNKEYSVQGHSFVFFSMAGFGRLLQVATVCSWPGADI